MRVLDYRYVKEYERQYRYILNQLYMRNLIDHMNDNTDILVSRMSIGVRSSQLVHIYESLHLNIDIHTHLPVTCFVCVDCHILSVFLHKYDRLQVRR